MEKDQAIRYKSAESDRMSRPPHFHHRGGGRIPGGRGGGAVLAMDRRGPTIPYRQHPQQHPQQHPRMMMGTSGAIPPPPSVALPGNSMRGTSVQMIPATPPPHLMNVNRSPGNLVSGGMMNGLPPPPPPPLPPPSQHSYHGRAQVPRMNGGRSAQPTSSHHLHQQRGQNNCYHVPNPQIQQQYPFPPLYNGATTPSSFSNMSNTNSLQPPHSSYSSASFNLPPNLNHGMPPQQPSTYLDNPRIRLPNNQYISNQHPIPTPPESHSDGPVSQPFAPGTVIPIPFVKEQVDQAWTEHTAPNGTVYYHNSLLKTSSYEKPDILKTKDAASKSVLNIESSKPWKQYTDPNTGKHYYSNGLSTTWDKPEGFIDTEIHHESQTVSEPPKKKKKIHESKEEIVFSSKEEAVTTFKALMLTKEIPPSTKWNDVVKLCATEANWIACEKFLTIGERKQALAEYQTKRSNDLRDLERQEKIQKREAFLQLLTEKLSETSGFSPWKSTLNDVKDRLEKDDRYRNIENNSIRESLFLDFCEEFKKREERRKRALRRDAQESFEAFLQEMEEMGVLTYSATWNSFISALGEKQRNDQRLEVSENISDSERQLYFADYIIHLQKKEDDRRSNARNERLRIDKSQREALLDDIKGLCKSGEILPTSTWRNVARAISYLPSFGPLQEQGRQDAREIFEDFITDWENTYRRDRSFLKNIVFPKLSQSIRINRNTNIDDFRKSLTDATQQSADDYHQVQRIFERSEPVSSARIFLNELLQEAKEQNESAHVRRVNTWRHGAESSEDEEGEIEE